MCSTLSGDMGPPVGDGNTHSLLPVFLLCCIRTSIASADSGRVAVGVFYLLQRNISAAEGHFFASDSAKYDSLFFSDAERTGVSGSFKPRSIRNPEQPACVSIANPLDLR